MLMYSLFEMTAFAFSICSLICVSTLFAAPASSNNALATAAIASQAWLDLVDNGRYDQSWDKASKLMKIAMPKEEWVEFLNLTRKPLGKHISRQVLDQRTAKNPHGLPQGDYMVMYYKTSFPNKPDVHELVTLFLEEGEWRVLTYQVN